MTSFEKELTICDFCTNYIAGECVVKGKTKMYIEGSLMKCSKFVFNPRDYCFEDGGDFE